MDEFFKDKDIDYKIFANQVYPDSVSGFNRGRKEHAFDVCDKRDTITSVFTI